MVANGRQTVAQLRDVLVEGFKVSWQGTLSLLVTLLLLLGVVAVREREREREREEGERVGYKHVEGCQCQML